MVRSVAQTNFIEQNRLLSCPNVLHCTDTVVTVLLLQFHIKSSQHSLLAADQLLKNDLTLGALYGHLPFLLAFPRDLTVSLVVGEDPTTT